MKKCDHTSVGILVRSNGKLLMISRARPPFGIAIPAGHVDADQTYEKAAIRELKEEVGLDAIQLRMILERRMENPCRRIDGTWHNWKLYEADFVGNLSGSPEETKKVSWFSDEEISDLARRTEQYRAANISEDDWQSDPGLEPVMYDLFKLLKII